MTYLPFLLFVSHVFLVMMWGYYEAIHLAAGGRWRPSAVVAFMALSLVLLLILAVYGNDSAWVIPDAISCADNAELVIEAVPGPAAGGLGDVHERQFYTCSAFWYAR